MSLIATHFTIQTRTNKQEVMMTMSLIQAVHSFDTSSYLSKQPRCFTLCLLVSFRALLLSRDIKFFPPLGFCIWIICRFVSASFCCAKHSSFHLKSDFITAVAEVFTVLMWADSRFPLLLWTTERVLLVGLYQGSWHYLIELCI